MKNPEKMPEEMCIKHGFMIVDEFVNNYYVDWSNKIIKGEIK